MTNAYLCALLILLLRISLIIHLAKYFLSVLLPELPDPTLIIDPITEERASRTLYRIELLRRIREQVLLHPLLEERLSLCQPSPDLPAWWEPGRHDQDLLRGAAKNGVSRTDYHILNDPELSFLEAHRKFTQGKGAELPIIPDPLTPLALVKDEEVKEDPDVLIAKVENGGTEDEVKEKKTEALSPKKEVKTEETAHELGLKQEPKEEKTEVEDKEEMTTKEEQVSFEDGMAEEKPMDQPLTLPTCEDKSRGEGEEKPLLTTENKLSTDKTSEDDDDEEEKMDEDDKSEKSSQAEG